MCGIYGVITADSNPLPSSWRDGLRNVLNHRGPDQNGCYDMPGVLLGANRLSILDLQGGAQPIFNEDNSLVIVYNGEIYNHLDLRRNLLAKGHHFRSHADTETVLHAFEEYGEECVRQLNGMFAFAIWNLRTRALFVARDRLGIKPLYVTETEERNWAFASEAKALLTLATRRPRVDWPTIFHYFSFGYCPSPLSPYEGIHKFPAGHFGWYRGNQLKTTRYWTPQYGTADAISAKEAQTEVLKLLEDVIQMELMSDVPVGVFLSGGLDSSAVALFAARHSKSRVSAFTLRFAESSHDESADARAVSEHLQLDHYEYFFDRHGLRQALQNVVDILDEPFADPTVLPLFSLAKFAGQKVKVVLTGWGGDELLAGYPTYTAHRWAATYRRLPQWLGRHFIPGIVNRLPISDRYMSLEFKARRFIQGMELPPEYQHFLWMGYFNDFEKRQLFQAPIRDQFPDSSMTPVQEVVDTLTERELVDRIMHLDMVFFLENNGLFQADRMTMAASLEARVPLLNNSLVDYVSALPATLKMQSGQLKGLLRSALQAHLPNRILKKPKKGFGPPISQWVRQAFKDVIPKMFDRKRIDDQGVFVYPEIKRLLSEHQSRRADHGRKIWALLGFQLWYEGFILGKKPFADMVG